MLFEKLIRPALYRLNRDDPETVHERTVRALSLLPAQPPLLRDFYAADDPATVFGLRFPNRVGLAAGMDKDGRALHAWPSLGFGFVEVGTVTRLAQPGNPKPRLFTLAANDAVVNRMGFNNSGADALARRLADGGKPAVPLGISIGKSKVVPLDDAVDDYRHSLRALYPYADYFAVNVSSPNTPGLRELQDKNALAELLGELQRTSAELAVTPTPLLVKVAPDLTDTALAELLEVCDAHGVAGVIATNTTLSRDGLTGPEAALGKETGGLSGRPLAARAREVVRFVHEHTEGRLPIIGVGGVLSGADARALLDAGASLVQVYTGFALRGPGLIREINRTLAGWR
ncbi:quinone-dependent dihydroorotate dehydrogenase [Amycolatopsis acidiphila]|uniref:Dihydroorotate dehydrogenase (quinone) n=1 Tax=Amycolatopsis acidiphila TaxID=715473 RepID=A0A557ZY66_9PSEU|nr:quinone-dependent dihydroorotate dehydrogenase [Amycolatopsis acidiphila]TVT16965.1 quinone-dependent dihydroorotate dehydrogenase [Amycolatopsis acidiphila]UIJ62133.1 quinone-dependent dihydroorotate dehydrogenase [Amycolatopsis acidiphila]GHG92028.1 dihydroorotate dehydrogenase (quinone) [Amycolatopsis acidiphila]